MKTVDLSDGMLRDGMQENDEGPLEKEDSKSWVGMSMAGGRSSSNFLKDVVSHWKVEAYHAKSRMRNLSGRNPSLQKGTRG